MKDLQTKVNDAFLAAFGRTPLEQRLDDIMGEATEAKRFTDIPNLKEEAGDLLCSVLQLMNECGWDAEELANATLDKIKRRNDQYKALGRKVKVAILGGAFDPVTNGHIACAQHVLNEAKEFDEVWLMPCLQHMYNKDMAGTEHRLAMCRLAAAPDKRISVSNYEIKNRLSGETYQLMKRLFEEGFSKNKYDFSFIIGLDNALTFEKWVNFRYLEKHVRFVVVPRAGIDYDPSVQWFQKPPHIFLPGLHGEEISSTLVRGLVKDGENVDRFVAPAVADYIEKHGLYKY